MINFKSLTKPFLSKDIEWRVQSSGKSGEDIWALVLPYVTNRAIMDRLDDVCGPGNWQNMFAPAPCGGVLCGLAIRIGVDAIVDKREEWVTKWDGAENTDIEAIKGGLSGSMKRAAVQWGIGRYLYRLETSWAKVNPQGTHRGNAKGTRFRWDPPSLPEWAIPKEEIKERLKLHDLRAELIRCSDSLGGWTVFQSKVEGLPTRPPTTWEAKELENAIKLAKGVMEAENEDS